MSTLLLRRGGPLRRALLTLLCLTLTAPLARAADYYWVGGTGRWNDLTHWARSSGGSQRPTQVPQSTDNVFFDANSFSASGQTVTISTTVTCRTMDWTGAVRPGISGQRLLGAGTVEVNGDLRLVAGLGQQEASFRLLAADAGHEVDLQNVPVNGRLSFDNEAGGWTFVSPANLVQYGPTPGLIVAAGSIDFGTSTVSCYGFRSTGARARSLDLNAATFLLQAPVNSWEVAGSNLILDAGSSLLRLGPTARSTANGYSFASTAQTYNAVEVAAGASAQLSVAGSTFKTLTINGAATFTTAATITGALTLGREALLRAASGQVLAFGPRATLSTAADCAGLAHLQASVPGRSATLQRAGGWGSTPLRYAAVQDLAFTGGGSLPAVNCLDRGGNQGASFTALPATDLYWVGGSGSWHDPAHWAATSGGSAAGNSCLPTLATNVHFDASSFAAGATITLDGANAFCRDLDWTGAPAATFRVAATDVAQKQLGIGGSLTLTSAVTLSLGTTDFVFYGYGNTQPATVTTAGRALTGNAYFRAAGAAYTLLDALTLAPGNSSPNGRLYVEAGTFNTNNQPVAAQGFTSGYAATASVFTAGSGAGGPLSGAAVTVNLGSSIISLTPASGSSDVGARTTYTWDVATGVTLNAGSSQLRISSNSTRNQPAYFRAGLGLSYNVVSFTDAAALSLPTLVSGGGAAATFGQLSFAGSASIGSSNTISQQLTLTAGSSYAFGATTQTFAADAQLSAIGGCPGYVGISGSSATARATFSKPSGGAQANQPLQSVALRNVAFSGSASWEATRSLDQGGTTGILYTQRPVPRTLYWVGGTGRWSELAHWALSSGGAGGNCLPTLLDDVLFDANSFSAPGQIVTQDVPLAACASLSWAGATHAPTFSGAATNRLQIYGPLTWSPVMSQQLLGETQLLGGGTLTSAGQLFGGALTIDAPGATVTLADALRQPRSGGSGLTLAAGTLVTNDQPVQLRSLTCVPTAGDPARTLRLGRSAVEITAGAWTISQPSSLTFDAGTSRLLLTGSTFNGNGFSYHRVETGSGAAHVLGGSSSIDSLLLRGDNTVTGQNTINQHLYLEPGATFLFGAGTVTTFGATARVQAVGTGDEVITLQSTDGSQPFTWTKPAGAGGTVCASYIYLRDAQAQGGAYFEAGEQANNQGNTTGWSFASLPQASYRSQQVCPQLGAHALRLHFSGLDRLTQQATPLAAAQFPLTVLLRNRTAGTTDTLRVPTADYDYPIPTSTSTAEYQVLSVATNGASCGPLVSPGPFPVVTDGPLSGPAGQWTGTGPSPDWLDCQNWASGTLPTAATDVTVAAGTTIPELNGPATVGTLRVQPGAQLTLGSAAVLTVSGDWLNEGSTVLDAQSQVVFAGSQPQQVSGGAFGRVEVNNAAGLNLLSDASSATSLTLTAGLLNTGAFQWQHQNPAAGSLSGGGATSYVAGTLRRALLSGGTATYAFPVGNAGQYAPLELLSNQLTGPSQLTARFGPKTDSDQGLSCADLSPALSYQAVHPAGLWTLTPDQQPSGGSYALRAGLAPFWGLRDNTFGLLKRPEASTAAADWTTGGGTLPANDAPGRRVLDGYALRSGLTSFSQFGLGLTAALAPLPVTLTSFQATVQGPDARLTWTTAQEAGISAYELERSADGQRFERVGSVPALAGTSVHRYAFTDVGAARVGPLLYYRLRILDAGTAAYGAVIALHFAGAAPDLQVWPTLFGQELHVAGTASLTGPVQFALLDARGAVVHRQKLVLSPDPATIHLPDLPAGLYLVQIQTASARFHSRVIHQP